MSGVRRLPLSSDLGSLPATTSDACTHQLLSWFLQFLSCTALFFGVIAEYGWAWVRNWWQTMYWVHYPPKCFCTRSRSSDGLFICKAGLYRTTFNRYFDSIAYVRANIKYCYWWKPKKYAVSGRYAVLSTQGVRDQIHLERTVTGILSLFAIWYMFAQNG